MFFFKGINFFFYLQFTMTYPDDNDSGVMYIKLQINF